MKPVYFHPAARNEMMTAAQYYESQLQGLGRRFLNAIAATNETSKRKPLIYPKIDEFNRRARVSRFPFFVVFREKADHIQIIAVAHFRRQPDYWSRRAGH